jgi:LysM repeat protein
METSSLRIIKRWMVSFLIILNSLLLIVWSVIPQFSVNASQQHVWGSRPVLGYFMLTPSLYTKLSEERILDGSQFQSVQAIARQEDAQLRQLEFESRLIIQDDLLSMQQKRQRILWMGYNQRVDTIVVNSKRSVEQLLDDRTYQKFMDWIDQRWQVERSLHGSAMKASNPRSYSIYATRFDAGERYIVALPDKCVKFANGGSHICDSDGYSVGQGYSVYIAYKKGIGVAVGDSGPWNVDDNYWSRLSDLQPRRMFADLGLGMPEAQAAYFNGYNGGKDQFGRKVTGPFGIDLARQVSIDIGLQPGVNDWITVSFMWTAGWDSGSAATTSIPGTPGTPASTSEVINPVQTVTPYPDGSIIHVVQPNEALWSIAIAYGTTIQSIRDLNKLSASSVIIPGQKLVIRPAGSITPPPLSTGTLPVTQVLTATASLVSSTTPSLAPSLTAPVDATQTAVEPEKTLSSTPGSIRTPPFLKGSNWVLILSIVFLAGGGLLLLLGSLLKRGR